MASRRISACSPRDDAAARLAALSGLWKWSRGIRGFGGTSRSGSMFVTAPLATSREIFSEGRSGSVSERPGWLLQKKNQLEPLREGVSRLLESFRGVRLFRGFRGKSINRLGWVAIPGAIALVLWPVLGTAQVAPNLDWRTLKTQHFYVHLNPPTENLARRIAADAGRAYAELSKELHPPRGMIDVVISDDVDFSNGSATPTPTNRIIVYANPPVSESALRYTNDWGQLVITHELTHIFHLDRTRKLWSLGQKIFGRAPLLFPNTYSPSWLVEGLAVYEESKLTGAGRIEGSEHRMIARAAALDHGFPAIGSLSLAQPHFPFGETSYSFGSLFIDYLAKTRGESHVREFVDKSAANLIPYLVDIP